jgi:hypothetical protein
MNRLLFGDNLKWLLNGVSFGGGRKRSVLSHLGSVQRGLLFRQGLTNLALALRVGVKCHCAAVGWAR